jgi:hypothetical protein
MKTEEVKHLLSEFYDGKTSTEQENRLLNFFENEQVPYDLQKEKEIFMQFFTNYDTITPPQLLEYKLDKLLDNLAVKRTGKHRKLWYWTGGIAASALLAIILETNFLKENKTDNQTIAMQNLSQTDIENIEKAEQAILLVSTKFNKGMSQLAMVDKNIHKIDENLMKINNLSKKFNK